MGKAACRDQHTSSLFAHGALPLRSARRTLSGWIALFQYALPLAEHIAIGGFIRVHSQVLRSRLKPASTGLSMVPGIDLANHATVPTVRQRRWHSCGCQYFLALVGWFALCCADSLKYPSMLHICFTRNGCFVPSPQAEYDYDQARGRFALKVGQDGLRAGAHAVVSTACTSHWKCWP
jgi:hypothetical protein